MEQRAFKLLAHLRGEEDFRFAPTDGDNGGLRIGGNRRIHCSQKGLIAGAGKIDQLFGSRSERTGNLDVERDLQFLVGGSRSAGDGVLSSAYRDYAYGRRRKASTLEICVQIRLQKAACQFDHGDDLTRTIEAG